MRVVFSLGYMNIIPFSILVSIRRTRTIHLHSWSPTKNSKSNNATPSDLAKDFYELENIFRTLFIYDKEHSVCNLRAYFHNWFRTWHWYFHSKVYVKASNFHTKAFIRLLRDLKECLLSRIKLMEARNGFIPSLCQLKVSYNFRTESENQPSTFILYISDEDPVLL